MGDWYSGDVIANGIRLHYHRTGGDKPPLVLSHGFSDAGLCWTRVAQALEADYDVIMPDSRGHGLSEAPEGGYNAEGRAADLAGLIQALGLKQPAIGGHSMGGQTTLYCSALYPEVVGKAILEDPAMRIDVGTATREEWRVRMEQMHAEIAERRKLSREQLTELGRTQHPTWDEIEFAPWVDAKQRMSPRVTGAGPGSDLISWQEALPKIQCPTLLITSDPELGGIVTEEAAALAKQLLPLIQIVRISGAGHNIRRERFDEFVGVVRAFLA